MSAGQQMPPWLQEQIAKMQQSQQNLQSILMQKQQVEMENAESDRALEELKKASDDDQVFKYAGTILIKSDKKSLIDELEEKLSNYIDVKHCISCSSGTDALLIPLTVSYTHLRAHET